VRRGELPGISEHDDLVLRAARLLREHCPGGQGAEIRLDKRLPMGGGLGGGSSDAATVLVALNRLWACGLETGRLAELGLQLGADVPIFVHGRAAWAEGVGDRLQPMELERPWYLVVVPPVHVSTAEVFQAPELTRNSSAIKIRAFIAGDRRNDCLPVVRERYPEVAQAIDWLSKYTEAKLTGTGACVFGAFASQASAEAVLAEMPAVWRGLVARGMNRSPLLDRLGDE
jgi:4-diphosphocytidyl-2-C-methyl-D-erythritol kinase